MTGGFGLQIGRPALVGVGAGVVVGAIIVTIGKTLLALHPHVEEGSSASLLMQEIARPDLWTAIGLTILLLVAAAFAARPRTQPGLLDRDLVVGKRDFFAEGEPAVQQTMRRGPLGALRDIREGDTLYAQSGPLAKVVAMLPGEDEYGKRRRGFIYASGVHGANSEMWIPVEAVIAVYPETRTVILAAKGDEIEHFGWNLPPASFRRGQQIHQAPKSF